MEVTVKEFKKNIDRYLVICKYEDVVITDGKDVVATLSSPPTDFDSIMDRLVGSLPPDVDAEKALAERLDNL